MFIIVSNNFSSFMILLIKKRLMLIVKRVLFSENFIVGVDFYGYRLIYLKWLILFFDVSYN